MGASFLGLSFLAIVASLLVIVHDFDFRRTLRCPNKAHPELVIDADRVLPFAIACQRFKPIAWRRPQVAEIARRVEIAQFAARHPDQIGRKALRSLAVEDGLGGPVSEAPDHSRFVSLNDTIVNPAYQSTIQCLYLRPP